MKSLLIVSVTGMGDSLWATPAIRALKKTFPNLSINLLTNKLWASLFHNNTNLDAEILKAYTSSLDGTPCQLFKVGQHWKFCFDLEVRNKIPSFIVSISIRSADGIYIRTIYDSPRTLEKGNYFIQILNDNFIYSSSTLFITIGISNFEKPIEYIEDIVKFEIINVPDKNLDSRIIRTNNSAFLLNPMKVHYDKKN